MNIDVEIQNLKSEAVDLLNVMFKILKGYSSGATIRIVECIVSAAILEIAKLNSEAVKFVVNPKTKKGE